MSQSCTIDKCSRKSRGLCDCCHQSLCLQHLNEHNASLLTHLNPLTDEMNTLSDRLKVLNIDKIIGNSSRALEQWRDDSHKQIDTIYKKKCEELNQLIKEKIEYQQNKLHQLHAKITEFINSHETTRQDIDSLTSSIHQLQENMNNMEKTSITIHTHPLVIDEKLIVMEKFTEHELDLSTLSPAYKTIPRSEESSGPIASYDRYLLMHQHPNLCLLDHEANTVKNVEWPYGDICDMCWSSTLDRFIVFQKENIFLLDKNMMSVKEVQVRENIWMSCTCSDAVLFVTTNTWGSSIMEFNLVPRIKFIKEWKAPVTCANDEVASDIVYNDGKLALLIMNESTKSVRIELRLAITLDRIWSLQLDIKRVNNIVFRCCSLPGNEWLIMDHEASRLLQVTEDGRIKKTAEYHPGPYRATLLDQNKLAISTRDFVNLHNIE